MEILVAPDSFKGSLSAVQFCEIAQKAILSICPDACVTKFPLADGGEGTVEALVSNSGGQIFYEQVCGPFGEPVNAHYGVMGDKETAVIEMAGASGLPLIPKDKRDPFHTTTTGVGQLILKAIERGCKKIIIGLGGSATNDGGAGAMQALGFNLLDKQGNSIKMGAEGLLTLAKIERGSTNNNLDGIQFIAACDVDNPLLGKNGASYTFAPQKGAVQDQLFLMEKSLIRYDKIMRRDIGKSVADTPGAGAAGGMGAGLMAFLDATMTSGFELIKEYTQIESSFKKRKFTFIITGEGHIDNQTVKGKLPGGVGKLGKKYDIPVIAVVGGMGDCAELLYEHGISSVFSIVDRPMELEEAVKNAASLLYRSIQRLMRLILAFEGRN